MDPDWAPDGRSIVFATDRDGSVDTPGSDESSLTTDIHRVRPDGSGETAITSTPNRAERQPRVSPGGVLVAYTERRASAYGGTSVVVANADGSCPRPLVPTTGDRSDWVTSLAWRPGSATTEPRETCP